MKRWIFLILVLSFFSNNHYIKAEPWEDALVLWQFSDLNDTNGRNSQLTLFGDVQTGIVLTGNELEESKLRGGDGRIVRIKKGGYLSANQGADSELNLSGRTMTIYLRLRLASTPENCPVFSKYGGHLQLSYNLYAFHDFLGGEMGTSQNKNLLAVRAPFAEMRSPKTASTDWHDVIFRQDGAKLEFFIDGRCVDEDFMLGDIRKNNFPVLIGAQIDDKGNISSGFEGDFDHIAIWNRALSEEEIITLSGGKEHFDRRERTDRGNNESLQYWCPPNQYGVGDCMPFFHDGVFHFVYLLDKYRHGAKNGLGAHQWIQATSTDLVHWKHQPFVIPITRQNEGSICTGSLFWNDGIYYAFYANRSFGYVRPDGKSDGLYGLLACSTSKDGIHFTKQAPEPLFFLPKEYSSSTRDPIVYKSNRDGLFHLYATTSFQSKGCWLHAVSPDLKQWSLCPPIFTARDGQPECPDWFVWGDKYYTIAGHTNGYYRISDSPDGPWDIPNGTNVLMKGIPHVPKTAPFGKNRRIICGWTGQRGFGGNAVFHELIRLPNGLLTEKFVPEMIPATGSPCVEEKNVRIKEKQWAQLPGNFRIQIELAFDPARRDSLDDWILTFGKDQVLRVSAADRTVRLLNDKLESVDFRPGTIRLDMIVVNDLVDLCVNNSQTLTLAMVSEPSRNISINDLSVVFPEKTPVSRDTYFKNALDKLPPGYLIRSLEIAPLNNYNK